VYNTKDYKKRNPIFYMATTHSASKKVANLLASASTPNRLRGMKLVLGNPALTKRVLGHLDGSKHQKAISLAQKLSRLMFMTSAEKDLLIRSVMHKKTLPKGFLDYCDWLGQCFEKEPDLTQKVARSLFDISKSPRCPSGKSTESRRVVVTTMKSILGQLAKSRNDDSQFRITAMSANGEMFFVTLNRKEKDNWTVRVDKIGLQN
jgi:hypothetical protein